MQLHSSELKLAGLAIWFLILSSSATASAATVQPSYQHNGADTALIEKHSFLILFETNRAQTDTFPEVQTEKLKTLLQDFPEYKVRLEARTDSIGSPKSNIELAKRRMNYAQNELIKRGINSERFMEFVFGEDEPLATNENPEGRQANRSVRVAAGLYTPLQIVSGRFVSESERDKGLEGVLYTGTRYHRDTFRIDSSGKFAFPVPEDDIFFIEFFSKDQIMGRTYFNLSRINPILGKIHLKNLEYGNVLNFEDILFKGNRADVLPDYQDALPRLLNMIRLASDYRFEIQGHVNFPFSPMRPKGTFQYELAERRAETIYTYLVESGIDPNRLEWKGYSNWYMVFPNPQNETQSRQNRRVSVKVLGRVNN